MCVFAPDRSCTSCGHLPGVIPVAYLYDPITGATGYVATLHGDVYVIFRGSYSLQVLPAMCHAFPTPPTLLINTRALLHQWLYVLVHVEGWVMWVLHAVMVRRASWCGLARMFWFACTCAAFALHAAYAVGECVHVRVCVFSFKHSGDM